MQAFRQDVICSGVPFPLFCGLATLTSQISFQCPEASSALLATLLPVMFFNGRFLLGRSGARLK